MIDAQHAAASWFLWIVGALFLTGFVLPLLFAPLRWARWFGWELPERRELAVYFGRCLGAVGLAVVLVCFRAAPDPARHRIVLELLTAGGALLTAVHVWGALRRQQPPLETAEIALYLALTGLAGWLYLGLRG